MNIQHFHCPNECEKPQPFYGECEYALDGAPCGAGVATPSAACCSEWSCASTKKTAIAGAHDSPLPDLRRRNVRGVSGLRRVRRESEKMSCPACELSAMHRWSCLYDFRCLECCARLLWRSAPAARPGIISMLAKYQPSEVIEQMTAHAPQAPPERQATQLSLVPRERTGEPVERLGGDLFT